MTARLPARLMTSEQAKILGTGLAAMSAPFLAAGYQRLGVPGDFAAGAVGAYGAVLVTLLAIFVGGKPEPKVQAAASAASEHAAREVELAEDGIDRGHLVARIRARGRVG